MTGSTTTAVIAGPPERYEVRVTATASRGASGFLTASLVVLDPASTAAPVVSALAPSEGEQVAFGATVFCRAWARSDADGALTDVDWLDESGTVFAHGLQASFQAARAGTAVVRCLARDSRGRTGECTRTIRVFPTVSIVAIVAPAAGSSFLPVDPIEFRGTAHDGADPQVDASDLGWASTGWPFPGSRPSSARPCPSGCTTSRPR